MPNYTLNNSRFYLIQDRDDVTHPADSLHAANLLNVKELVSQALGDNTKLKDSLTDYELGSLISAASVEEIEAITGLAKSKSSQLLAILAVGKRLYAGNLGSLVQIRSRDDVYNHCRSMSNLSKENLRLLLINSRYQLVHDEIIAMGSLKEARILPRDIFQPAVERRVSSVILAHNHPSGDTSPSQSDMELTRMMIAAGELLGIELLDHIIIGNGGYESCLVDKIP